MEHAQTTAHLQRSTQASAASDLRPLAACIQALIVDQLGCDPDLVKPEARLAADLACDSLDVVELAMAIEHELNIEAMPDDELQVVKTVQQLIDVVRKYAPAGATA